MVVDLAARPHITAGIALASAAVLTAAPVTQHLPNLSVTQHLREVSANIQLTNVTDSAVDLFAGVESELASLASGASAAATPAGVLDGVVNPLQTWINIIPSALTNVQNLGNDFLKVPFPILQQVAANGAEYGQMYVGAWQTSANAFAKFYFGNTASSFIPVMQRGITDWSKGMIAPALSAFYQALWQDPIINIGEPLENILKIPIAIAQNLANFTNTTLTDAPIVAVLDGVLAIPLQMKTALSNSLVAAYNAWNAGETLGAITNILDIPGEVTNAAINGTTGNAGLLGSLAPGLLTSLPQTIAKSIVAPNAQNIANGGSLAAGIQGFVTTLTNGWPSLTASLGTLGPQLTSILQGIPSALAGLPSTLAGMAGSLATHLGTLLMQLLKLL
ncbi:hypothetical protein BMG05_12350 [Mycobacterium malmoense]|nr:hypothetical protein BMG05_12350 [Mycobacterium malmoense]